MRIGNKRTPNTVQYWEVEGRRKALKSDGLVVFKILRRDMDYYQNMEKIKFMNGEWILMEIYFYELYNVHVSVWLQRN